MVNPKLVPNRNAKNILNPSTTRKRAEYTRDESDASNEESEEIAKSKASGSKIWTTLGIRKKNPLETLHTRLSCVW